MTPSSILDAFTWLFRAVYTLASSIFLLLFEGCGRLLGIFGALAVVALVLCGCNHGGEGAWYTGAVVGDDGQLTPIGLLLFAAGVLWAPLGWSTADLAVGAALAPTLYIWLLPQLRDGCSGFLGEVGADVSLLGLCRLSRSMGALVALFYPALLLLNLRGGAGAWPDGGGGFTSLSGGALGRLRATVAAADAFFWLWLVAGALLRRRPDWCPGEWTPMEVDASLFGGFLLAAAAHTREQHLLQPCRLSLLSAAAIGAVGAAVLAALAAGDTPPLGPPLGPP